MTELRDIPGFEGLYAATRDGKVWSHKRKKFMKPCGEPDNYQIMWLSKEGECKCYYVHRLIALAYIPNPNNYPKVNHIDEHKDHNWADNLEWCTQDYNLMVSSKLKRKPVYCIELDKHFPSIRKACIELNLLQGNVSTHLSKNVPKSVGGYHFKYE